MKKSTALFILILFLIGSCQENKVPVDQAGMNRETTIDDEKMLIGPIDRAGFQMEEYKSWFDSTYQAYDPKDSILTLIRGKLENVSLQVFIGSWCSDSQRDVPALFRILDELETQTPALNMIAIDRSKTLPESELEGYDIEYVPTFIIYRDTLELGRIVEVPEQTLEEDLLSLLVQQ